MDLRRLNHLVLLADERNFGRAAERAHLSQSAFSRSVQAAESELGVQLFDRGTLEATCTPAGSFVIERARKLLFDSRCLERDVELFRQKLIGDIAFGMGPFPAHTLLPTLLVELRQKFPGVGVRVQVTHWNYLVQNLRREELDFFVADTRDLPLGPDLDITPLPRQHGGFYVRAGHPLLAKARPRPQDMIPYGLATVRLPTAVQDTIRRLLGLHAQAPLPSTLECEDVAMLKRVALATDTVLASTRAAVHAEVLDGRFLPLALEGLPPLYSETGLVALRGRSHSPMAEYVLGRLTALAADMAALGQEARGLV